MRHFLRTVVPLAILAAHCNWGSATSGGGGNGLGAGGGSTANDPAGSLPVDDPSIPSAPAKLTGARVFAGQDLALLDVTEDDLVIFSSDGALQAVPAAGGTPTIVDSGSQLESSAHGVVFSWKQADTASGRATLTAWTARGGARRLTTASSIHVRPVATSDGARVVYAANVAADGQLGDVYVAGSDGTGAVRALSGKRVDAACPPRLHLLPAALVVGYCEPGTTVLNVAAVDLQGGASRPLLTGVSELGVDSADGLVYAISAIGVLEVVAAAGGAVTTLDVDTTGVRAASDGRTLFYTTETGALKRVTLPTALTPATLVAAGVKAIDAVAGNGAALLVHSLESAVTDDVVLQDVALASSAKANQALVPLVATPTAWMPGFSGDAATVAYGAQLRTRSNGEIRYVLSALPAAGGAARMLSSTAADWHPLSGSRALVLDNEAKTSELHVDLRLVDLSGAAAAQTLAERIEPTVLLMRDQHRVVYLYAAGEDQAGVYVAPLP